MTHDTLADTIMDFAHRRNAHEATTSLEGMSDDAYHFNRGANAMLAGILLLLARMHRGEAITPAIVFMELDRLYRTR